MTRCAIYVRVSTEGQTKGTSPETQLAVCTAFAESQGWEIVKVGKETKSGKTFKFRPVIQDLIADAQAGRIDAFLTHELDRATRGGVFPAGWLIEELHAGDCVLWLSDGMNSMEHPMEIIMKALGGSQEHKNIRERVIRAREATIRAGRPHIGPANYGYQHRREQVGFAMMVVGLDPHPDTAPVARRIFEMMAAGKSMHAVSHV